MNATTRLKSLMKRFDNLKWYSTKQASHYGWLFVFVGPALFILKVSSTRMPLFEEEMNRLFTNCELPIFFVHLRGMSRQECIQGFTDNIFWDVDRDHIDLSLHAPYVVQRVLEYGQISDWKLLLAYYGLDEIVSISKNLRSLEPRALSFISTISRTPQEQFRCYNTRQSNPKHCNF